MLESGKHKIFKTRDKELSKNFKNNQKSLRKSSTYHSRDFFLLELSSDVYVQYADTVELPGILATLC